MAGATASVTEPFAPPLWLVLGASLGVTTLMVAGDWDLSWHRSIGRDTFFTPPHSVLYGGALLACLAALFSVVRATASRTQAQAPGIEIWGLCGPLGAFVIGWGGVAMIASGLLDNWWHATYGLDIVVQSVPHIGIIGGMFAIFLGSLLLTITRANLAPRATALSSALIVHGGGMVLTLALATVAEDTFNYLMHGARFFCIVALVVPCLVVAAGDASGRRYARTGVALAYTLLTLAMLLVLPSFPAEPRLGPVLHAVHHFVPPPFPLLLVPAVAVVDGLRARFAIEHVWGRSAVEGGTFLVCFAVVQWPFASFLHTPLSDNRLFAGNEFAFFQAENSIPLRRLFFATESTPAGFWFGMTLALGLATLSTRVGIAGSARLRELRR